MIKRIAIGCLAILLAGFATPARADLSVSIVPENPPIAAGGTGTIDVYITSNAAAANPDPINTYGFTLQITQTTGTNNTTGFLKFSINQNFNFVNDTNYIFYNESPGPTGGTTTTTYPQDTFAGGDSALTVTDNSHDGHADPVSLSAAGGPKLLASLTLTAPTNEVGVGNAFLISLEPGSGNGSITSSSQTYFDIINFNTGNEVSHVAYTSTAGTVTIGPGVSSIIPEPASTVTSLTGAVLLAVYGWCRLRRSKAHDPASL